MESHSKDDSDGENIIYACAKIAHYLGYSIEDIIHHSIEWIEEILKSITRQEFENNIFEMALHGVPQKTIDKLKRDFENQFKTEDQKRKERLMPISEFQRLGIRAGKPTGTKVIRGKRK